MKAGALIIAKETSISTPKILSAPLAPPKIVM
jgi:hypothetical protein